MGGLFGGMWSAVVHVVSVDEMTMAATVGKFYLSLEIYKPAIVILSERIDNPHLFSDTDSHL